MRRFLILLFFVVTICFARTSEARKLALLIGVDEYDNVPPLKCCVNDMKTLKDALLQIGFEEDDIQVLTTGGSLRSLPTKEKIEQYIATILSEAQPKDQIFIAFSGHGAQEGKNTYFCPPFTDPEDLEGTCVSITKMMDDLAQCKAKFKWVVVDACRNDPTQRTKGIGSKGLQTIPSPPAGIALFQSCAEGEESWEDHESGNGYFTKNFAAALSGAADSDNDGQLTVMEVCKWTTAQTKEQVMASQNKSQKPYFSGSLSDFVLMEDVNVPKAKALAAEAQKAMEEKNYKLAIKKFDEALALCPQFDSWKRERKYAEDLLNHPKIDHNSLVVPDNYATIEEAYANIEDGGTILIKPGKYELSQTLEIDRDVTFKGDSEDPQSVVIDCPSSHAVQINDGSSTFQYLSVSSSAKAKRKTTFDGFFIKGGTPKIYQCIVTSVSGKGINVEGKKANPTVEKCTIKNCGKQGVYVNKKGSGVFKECEMYNNLYAGIVVIDSGNPTVIECKMYDGSQGGVLVWKKGLGEFRNCDIYGNGLAGVEVRELGNPTLVGCKIHNGKLGGVLVWRDGRGKFTDCEIYENKMAGIEVRAAGKPIVTKCNIHDGEQQGIWIHSKGMGVYSYNTLSGHEENGVRCNWVIEPSAGPVRAVGNNPPFQRLPALAPIRMR